jgi:ABC-2 type transport system permease protein
MSSFAGTASLVRLYMRRDRLRTPAWIIALVGLMFIRISNVIALYPTQESLDKFARIARDSPAAAALNGRPVTLDTIGGRVSYEILVSFTVALGLMSLLLIARHTRAEEQAGRTELLRSRVVGRHAQPAAAVALVAATNLTIAVLTTATLVSFGLSIAGSAVLAAGAAMVGIVFATIAAVTAQMTVRSRAASGIAGALLAAAFALRAIADTNVGPLAWLSPIGWAQAAEPYGHDRWWPLLLGLLVAAIVMTVALWLAGGRDVGSALLTTRPGCARGAKRLASPVALAIRLQRGAMIGWLVGITAYGAIFAMVGREVEEVVESTPTVAELLSSGQGTLVETYLSTVAVMLALITAAYVVQGLLRMWSEESEGRAEIVVATPVSSLAWAGSHVAVVAVGSAAILGISGATVGLIHGLLVGELSWVGVMAAANLAQVPAVWILGGLVLAIYGTAPRLSPSSWVALGIAVAITFLAEPTQLPRWVRDLSPFTHLAQLPVSELTLTAPTLLLTMSGALAAVGLVGLRRRDLHA